LLLLLYTISYDPHILFSFKLNSSIGAHIIKFQKQLRRKMCHEGFYPLYTRCHVYREVQIVVDAEAGEEPAVVAGRARGGGDGAGEDGSIKQCVCSPSKHPGSFRCRQHQAKYVWRNRKN